MKVVIIVQVALPRLFTIQVQSPNDAVSQTHDFSDPIPISSLCKTSVHQRNLTMHFGWMFCEKRGYIYSPMNLWRNSEINPSHRVAMKKIPNSRCFRENIACYSLFVFLFGFICNDLSSKFWSEYAGQVSSWKHQVESLTTAAECALGSAAHAVPKST